MGCVSCLYPAYGQRPWGEERLQYWQSWNKDSWFFFTYVCMWCACSHIGNHVCKREHACMCVPVWKPEVNIRIDHEWFLVYSLKGRGLSIESRANHLAESLPACSNDPTLSAFQVLELQEGCHTHHARVLIANSLSTELPAQPWLLWFLTHLQ